MFCTKEYQRGLIIADHPLIRTCTYRLGAGYDVQRGFGDGDLIQGAAL